jgi:hypothetical protein
LQPQILKNGAKQTQPSILQLPKHPLKNITGDAKRRQKVSSAKSTYTRYSGMSQREFSEKDFNVDGRSNGLKKFKNAL